MNKKTILLILRDCFERKNRIIEKIINENLKIIYERTDQKFYLHITLSNNETKKYELQYDGTNLTCTINGNQITYDFNRCNEENYNPFNVLNIQQNNAAVAVGSPAKSRQLSEAELAVKSTKQEVLLANKNELKKQQSEKLLQNSQKSQKNLKNILPNLSRAVNNASIAKRKAINLLNLQSKLNKCFKQNGNIYEKIINENFKIIYEPIKDKFYLGIRLPNGAIKHHEFKYHGTNLIYTIDNKVIVYDFNRCEEQDYNPFNVLNIQQKAVVGVGLSANSRNFSEEATALGSSVNPIQVVNNKAEEVKSSLQTSHQNNNHKYKRIFNKLTTPQKKSFLSEFSNSLGSLRKKNNSPVKQSNLAKQAKFKSLNYHLYNN